MGKRPVRDEQARGVVASAKDKSQLTGRRRAPSHPETPNGASRGGAVLPAMPREGLPCIDSVLPARPRLLPAMLLVLLRLLLPRRATRPHTAPARVDPATQAPADRETSPDRPGHRVCLERVRAHSDVADLEPGLEQWVCCPAPLIRP